MNLSKNFTLEELTISAWAKRHGVSNKPNALQQQKLANLCKYILQPLREMYGRPIVVTSGYRNAQVNAAAGGASNSDHKYGNAADIRSVSDTPADNKEIHDLVVKMYKSGKLPRLKQCINEYGYDWVHVAYQDGRSNLIGDFKDAKRVGKTTVYTKSKI